MNEAPIPVYSKSTCRLHIRAKVSTPHEGEDAAHHRHTLIEGMDQEKFQNSHVTVVGCGAGSLYVFHLTQKGICGISLYDADHVERSNCNRQYYRINHDLEKNKAHALAKNIASFATHSTDIDAYALHFEDAQEWDMLPQRTEMIHMCIDNWQGREAVARWAYRHGIPLINIMADDQAQIAEIFVQEKGKACLGCHYAENFNDLPAHCKAGSSVDISSTIIGYSLYATDTIIQNRTRNWNFKRINLGGFGKDISTTIERNPHCPICGNEKE